MGETSPLENGVEEPCRFDPAAIIGSFCDFKLLLSGSSLFSRSFLTPDARGRARAAALSLRCFAWEPRLTCDRTSLFTLAALFLLSPSSINLRSEEPRLESEIISFRRFGDAGTDPERCVLGNLDPATAVYCHPRADWQHYFFSPLHL
jgi:hypothetical protein